VPSTQGSTIAAIQEDGMLKPISEKAFDNMEKIIGSYLKIQENGFEINS